MAPRSRAHRPRLMAREGHRWSVRRPPMALLPRGHRPSPSRARATQIMGIPDLSAPIVDYLASLLHEGKCHLTERQLRGIRGLPTEEEQAEAFGEFGELAGKSVPSGHSEAGATAMRRGPSGDPPRVPCPPAQDGTECSRLHVLGCISHQDRSRRTGISVGLPADLGLGAFAPSAAWAYMQCRRCRGCRSTWIRAPSRPSP